MGMNETEWAGLRISRKWCEENARELLLCDPRRSTMGGTHKT
jgi:hypothetical protein